MNTVILMGRLTADPELKTTPNNTYVTSFTIAVDRRTKEKETDFIRCIAWRHTAEFVNKYFSKGDMIAVIGSIQTRTWDNNGKKMYATEVVINEVNFTGGKKENGYNTQPSQQQTTEDFIPLDDDNENDLPF